MIEPLYRPLPAIDRGPFVTFVLRRLLRVLAATILIVLLSGVVIANDPGYRERLRAEEMEACRRAAEQTRARYEPADLYMRACTWYPGRIYG